MISARFIILIALLAAAPAQAQLRQNLSVGATVVQSSADPAGHGHVAPSVGYRAEALKTRGLDFSQLHVGAHGFRSGALQGYSARLRVSRGRFIYGEPVEMSIFGSAALEGQLNRHHVDGGSAERSHGVAELELGLGQLGIMSGDQIPEGAAAILVSGFVQAGVGEVRVDPRRTGRFGRGLRGGARFKVEAPGNEQRFLIDTEVGKRRFGSDGDTDSGGYLQATLGAGITRRTNLLIDVDWSTSRKLATEPGTRGVLVNAGMGYQFGGATPSRSAR